MINVTIIPILEDNYTYLLEGPNGLTGVVDPGESGPVITALSEKGLGLDYIFNTHHHSDHIAGNRDLCNAYGARIAGPAGDAHRIAGMDIDLRESEPFDFGGEKMLVLETPGHTSGAICLYFPESKTLFTGDTLFSLSCGRLFEGTPEQMWQSLGKITTLPDDARIYCGHEYTQENGKFCLTIEPDNLDLLARMKEVDRLREENRPTIPSTIGLEKKTNVLLRAGSAQRFALLRDIKNRF